MTSGHFIFIPGVLTIGVVIGFILGGRAARDALEMEKRKEEARAEAKEAREARKKAQAEAAAAGAPGAGAATDDKGAAKR